VEIPRPPLDEIDIANIIRTLKEKNVRMIEDYHTAMTFAAIGEGMKRLLYLNPNCLDTVDLDLLESGKDLAATIIGEGQAKSEFGFLRNNALVGLGFVPVRLVPHYVEFLGKAWREAVVIYRARPKSKRAPTPQESITESFVPKAAPVAAVA
jgi:hypothetical protein